MRLRVLTLVASWRLALRLARREALRAPGRSALVIAMIALPILAVTAADIVLRSSQPSTAEELTRELGGFDAWLQFDPSQSSPSIVQSPDGMVTAPAVSQQRPPGLPHGVKGLLPPRTTVLAERSDIRLTETPAGALRTDVSEFDAGAAGPLTHGMLTLTGGHYATRPGEIAASDAFLDASGLSIGATLHLADARRAWTITGSYEIPDRLDHQQIMGLPGAVLSRSGHGGADGLSRYYAAVPGDDGVTWDLVKAANDAGLMVRSRAVILDPPPADEVPLNDLTPGADTILTTHGETTYDDGGRVDDNGGVAIVAGIAVAVVVLEICLLAGPAFAIGERRARRQLGLIAAQGGTPRQLRTVILAEGTLLGAIAAAVGLAGGVGLTWALRGRLEEWDGSRFPGLDIRVTELAAIAGLAVLAGLLAALVPAVLAGRRDVLVSLTGRRGTRRAGGRLLPALGAAALVVGGSLALVGAWVVDNPVLAVAGIVLAELGLVAMVPALLGAVGRLARWLPLPGRLALRDTARNRRRTAPAVAAILAAVAGAVAATTYLVSEEAEERAAYQPRLPAGAVYTEQWDARDARAVQRLTSARAAVERELPVTGRADLAEVGLCGTVPGQSEARRCGKLAPWGYAQAEWGILSNAAVLAGGPETLEVLGIDDPEAAAALRRGDALVNDAEYLDEEGRVSLEFLTTRGAEVDQELPLTLPAHVVDEPTYGLHVLMTPATAMRHGLTLYDAASLYGTTRQPTDAEREAAEAATAPYARAGEPGVYVETGYQRDEDHDALLALALLAGLVTLCAAGIATGLALADAAADHATLASVGARPRVRRALSGAQCAVLAVIGVVLGAVAGVIPAIGMRLTEYRDALDDWERWGRPGAAPEFFLTLPWGAFAQLIVAVPVLACLLAALLTRSRVPLMRRGG